MIPLSGYEKSKKNPKGAVSTAPTRRAQQKRSETFRVGRTMAGEMHSSQLKEHSRLQERKKTRRKDKMVAVSLGVIILAVILAIGGFSYEALQARKTAEAETEVDVLKPTVQIVDENKSDSISSRITTFVAQLEQDVKEYGYAIDHVVLPYQMAREVVVYIDGRSEYYKMSVDRGSAVQAEDMSRMIRYIDDNEIKCGYVDLRVEGRAYYK